MKNTFLSITMAAGFVLAASAYDVAWFATSEGNKVGMHVEKISRVAHNDDKSAIVVTTVNGTSTQLDLSLEPELTFASTDERVDVTFNASGIVYANPLLDKDVTVSIKDEKVSVKALCEEEITIKLTGESPSAYIEIDNEGPLTLILDNLNLSHASKATIKVEGKADVNMVLKGENKLVTEGQKKHAVSLSGNVTISGDALEMEVYGDQSKCIKADGSVILNDVTLKGLAAGDVVIEDGDTSYCTVIKTDGDFTMNGGSLEFTCTGLGGKGISTDGNAYFHSGTVKINCSGNGDVYVNADGENEAYSSTCITIDGDLNVFGGHYELSNSGSGGKCIKVDMALTIGKEDADMNEPYIEATTTGARFVENAATGGGWGWGDDNTDYANPKVVAAEGNVTVLSGQLKLKSTQNGGEGLESKDTMTISGGNIDISTVDDAINASNHIQINGGVVHCISSGNDGIDSNGTFTMDGGILFTAGSRSPEGGIDCDQNRLSINGGVIVGVGSSSSNPTSSACTQRVVMYTTSLQQNGVLTVTSPSGEHILSITNPVNIGSTRFLISAPEFMQDGEFTIYSGGEVSGGEEVYNLIIGGEYTPGSRLTSFTPSSAVTNAGGGGGRPW